MKLNKDQVNVILKNAPVGSDKTKILDGLIERGYELEGVDTNAAKESMAARAKATAATTVEEPAKPEQTVLQDAGDDFLGIGRDIVKNSQKRADNIGNIKAKLKSGEKGDAAAIFETAGQLAGAGADAIGSVFKGVFKMVLSPKSEQQVKGLINDFGQEVIQNPGVQSVVKWYDALPDDKKDALDAVGGFASLASEFVGAGAAKKAATVAKEAGEVALDATKQGAKATKEAIVTGVDNTKQVVNNIKSAIIPQTVKENVAKVLKNTGKKSLKDAASMKALDDGAEAFDIIHKNAPNIKVIDINGVEKAFNGADSNFFELPQALQQTKQAVYNSYTKMATEAGDAGVNFGQKEFTELKDFLSKYEGKGYTPAFTKKANELKATLDRYGTLNEKDGVTYFKNTSPNEVQDLIQQINTDVNLGSDRAGAQVANDFSSELRKMMDSKIESSGNPAYQATRTQYAKLKSIENDIITRYKEALRKSGANPSIIDGVATLDGLMGVITLNPSNIVRAAFTKSIQKAFQYLKDPEVNMRRVFKLLDEAVAPAQ